MSGIYESSGNNAFTDLRILAVAIVSVICEHEGMAKPTIRQVVDELNISRSYACDVLNNKQQPRALIVEIYRRFGWKAPLIEHMTDDQIAVIEEAERLSPTGRAAA